jgi:Domain of unknown function (DUF1833)
MTFVERRQRITDTASPLLFLEISSTAFPETLRMVQSSKDYTRGGQLYRGVQFSIKPPDQAAGSSPSMTIQIGNVGMGMTEDLEALGPQDEVFVKLMVTDRAEPEATHVEYNLPIARVSAQTLTVTAEASVDFIMRQAAVRLIFDPFTAPGIVGV